MITAGPIGGALQRDLGKLLSNANAENSTHYSPQASLSNVMRRRLCTNAKVYMRVDRESEVNKKRQCGLRPANYRRNGSSEVLVFTKYRVQVRSSRVRKVQDMRKACLRTATAHLPRAA